MIREGAIVRATAGRDCGGYFVVVGFSEDGRVLLCDGRHRRLASPKRKNLRHIEPTDAYAPEALRSDKAVRRLLRNRLYGEDVS